MSREPDDLDQYSKRRANQVFPPSRPQRPPWHGWAIDQDPLHVESVDPGSAQWVRRQPGYPEPVPSRWAWFGLGICIGIVVFALVFTFGRQLDAASRSGQTTDPIDVSRASSAALSGAPSAGIPTSPPPLVTPVPSPTGEVGTALIGGWATYYATCSDCGAAGPLLQAALGPDWQGKTVRVVSDVGEVDVRLVTSCACGDRTRNGVTRPTIIDVSLEAFGELSSSPAGSATDPGYVMVSIEIGGPGTTLPPTDLPPHPDDERMRLEVRGDELYR